MNRKNEKYLEKAKSDATKIKEENLAITAENVLLNQKIKTMDKEIHSLNEQLLTEKNKKISAQKINSYMRTELKSVKEKMTKRDIELDVKKKCTECEISRTALIEKENELADLSDYIDNQKTKKVSLKNEDGSYSNEVRLCIMELSGLEVAVEKVSPVIQAISKNICLM